MVVSREEAAELEREEFPLPARPGRVLLSLLGILLLSDLLLSLALSPLYETVPLGFERSADLRAYLAEVAESSGEPWLLIGDSVLVGNLAASEVNDWPRHRIVEYLAELKDRRFPEEFHQVALDGLVPVDLERIVAELDLVDPRGRVSLLIELNPRFFSAAYANDASGSRDWLAPPSWLVRLRDRAIDFVPVLRYRRHFARSIASASLGWVEAEVPLDGDSDLELSRNARVLTHYRDLDLGDDSSQILALRQTRVHLDRIGRRGTFFTTPLNDDFMREAGGTQAAGAFAARMSEILDPITPKASQSVASEPAAAEAQDSIRLVHLDAPLFRPEHFIDHCHLRPEGNRLLAMNLLHELNIGLEQTPRSTHIVYPDDADRSLVARVEHGFNDGARWQALFDTPRGLALDDRANVFVADTRNHCIRLLAGNYQSVRTVAGVSGTEGELDGLAPEATFSFPTLIVHLAGELYIVDGRDRTRLRVLDLGRRGEAARVRTLENSGWTRIDRLRALGSELFILDEGRRILRMEPSAGRAEVVAVAPSTPDLVSFDVALDGRVFAADRSGRIWLFQASAEQAVLVFSNAGETLLPTGDAIYPLAFDELRLQQVQDLHFVERYQGLLVRDRDPPKVVEERYEPTESIHLRFLSLEDRLVYPWLKPLTAGNAYIGPNVRSHSIVSNVHQGASAIHQPTASLFYLEDRRSRLFIINDGIWGSARLSHAPLLDSRPGRPRDPFGERLGERVASAFRPDRFLGERLERQPRRGPFVGIFLGSSFTVTSDVSSQYSLARAVETRLGARLGYRDRVRYEQLSRMRAGLRFRDAVELFESHVVQGIKLDAAFIALNRPPLSSEDELPPLLDRLRRLAASYDTKVILIDNGGLGAPYREGLRSTAPETKRLLRLAASTGFETIELNDSLLREHLRTAPWGSPPYEWNHASPWAIDATAELLAERAYPILSEHFRDRRPGFEREAAVPLVSVDPNSYLGAAFEGVSKNASSLDLLEVAPTAIQRRFDGHRLVIYIDLTRAGWEELARGEQGVRQILLSVLYELTVVDRVGAAASEAEIILAAFSNYDEYGQGVLESAEILDRLSLDRERLDETLDAYRAGEN